MPHLTLPITAEGCELTVSIGVSHQRRVALSAAGKSIPSLESIRMIVDTGATGSAIDESVVKKLGLTPTGTTSIHTPSTKGVPLVCATYDIMLVIGHTSYPMINETVPIIASDFSGQNIHGLLGCDVLRKCLFLVDGVEQKFTLAF